MRTAFILAVVLAAPLAQADNALRPEQIPAKARELANRGRAAHDAGDYTAAIDAYKEAYVLAPSPGLLFNIAQAYRLAGNCDEAAWMYRRYLDTNPNGPNKALAEQHLSVVEKCGSGGLKLDPPKPAANIPDPRNVEKPRSAIHASLTTQTTTDDARGTKFKHLGIGLGVGAGAALAGAVVFALDAHAASTTVTNTYEHGGKWSDVKDTDARGKRSALFATALGVTGGVALASGVVLYGLGRRYETAQHVALVPTSHGAQVSLSWGF